MQAPYFELTLWNTFAIHDFRPGGAYVEYMNDSSILCTLFFAQTLVLSGQLFKQIIPFRMARTDGGL